MVIIGHGHLSEVGPGDGRSLLSKSNDPFDNILKDSLQYIMFWLSYICALFVWLDHYGSWPIWKGWATEARSHYYN